MAEARINRRLSAILAADVVGYSRMMASDEAGTLTALKHHRQFVFNPAVARYDGRVIKLIGDGTLVEFGSVVDAVSCALSVQRAAASIEAPVSSIRLRIGVNLGDVIIDSDDIYGDGVNVAARLEQLAEPGGICIASIVNESVGNRVDATFQDGGEVQVKNIERPIRIWRWHPSSSGEAVHASSVSPTVAARDALPSLAVLPFQNMSGDAEQDYFADGVVEDLITALSRFKSFAVIARNSRFVYKGRSVDVRQVARELGVRYVLEGSVRHAGNRLRIAAQLIDGESGSHLWAHNFDGAVADIFEFQDRIAENVVGVIEPEIRKAEIERARRKRPESLDAYDLYLRAVPLVYGMDPDGFPVAIELLHRAAALDPSFALAPTYAAWTYEKRGALCLPPLGPNDREICLGLARRALALGGDDPLVRAICGWVLFAVGGDVSARNALYQAKEANPNSVVILVLVGFAKAVRW